MDDTFVGFQCLEVRIHLHRLCAKILDLSFNHLCNDRDIIQLSRLPCLKTLLLGNNDLGSFPELDVEERFCKLQILDMEQNNINDTTSLRNIFSLRNLTVLNLSYNKIDCVDYNIKEEDNLFMKLEDFYLSGNQIQDITELGFIEHCKSLHNLVIDGNPVCGKRVKGLDPEKMNILSMYNSNVHIYDLPIKLKKIKSKTVQKKDYVKAGLKANEWARYQIIERPMIIRKKVNEEVPFPVEETILQEPKEEIKVEEKPRKGIVKAKSAADVLDMAPNQDGVPVRFMSAKKRVSIIDVGTPEPTQMPSQEKLDFDKRRSKSVSTLSKERNSRSPDVEGPIAPVASPTSDPFFMTETKIKNSLRRRKKAQHSLMSLNDMHKKVLGMGDPDDPADAEPITLPKMKVNDYYKLLYNALEKQTLPKWKTLMKYGKDRKPSEKDPQNDIEVIDSLIDHVYDKLSVIEVNLGNILRNDYLFRNLPDSEYLLKEIQDEYERIRKSFIPEFPLPALPTKVLKVQPSATVKKGSSDPVSVPKTPIEKIRQELSSKASKKLESTLSLDE